MSFSPTSAVVGASITISGASLTQTTNVTIAGKAAAFTVVSGDELAATVSAGAKTGDSITVTTTGGAATSTAKLLLEPLISSFTPKTGKVSTAVTIAGHTFTGMTAVTFGGVAAASR